MFRLFDFSLPLAASTDELVGYTIADLVLVGLSVYFIYYSDYEARRLVDMAKAWGKRVGNDEKEFQRKQIEIVVGCSVGLVISLFLIVRFCVELLRRF
jgi:hypothetical protein